MKRLLPVALLLCLASASFALSQTAVPRTLTGVDRRATTTSLDGPWATIVDPYFNGLFSFHHQEKSDGWFLNRHPSPSDTTPVEYDFSKSPKLKVPADWNTQRDALFFYEGPIWYQRDFTYQPQAHHRVFLHVGAANYRSWFWINGKKVCEHEGGFTSFDCEITAELKPGANFVVAAVDNTRHADGVPTLETDWWNYGGLTRSVSLVDLPESFIDQYDLHLERGTSDQISGWAHVDAAAPGSKVTVELPELGIKSDAVVAADGRASFHFTAHGLERWSPEHPRLYAVKLTAGADQIDERMGFRTIEVRGTEILLNGEPIFLRGISIHAEAPYRTGRANTSEDAETLLGWAKELSCNYVRLAHYPHDESMLRTADRLGLLVWAENPVYWAVEFDNPAVFAKASHQLEEEVAAERNHAAIILWSMANETPNTPARTRFIASLAAHARELDSSRLITAALLVRGEGSSKIVDDPLGSALDVIGVNEYIGWYEQHPESAEETTWKISYQKPVIVSEFGGGARAGRHGAETERWTEEYQAAIYRHQIPMLNRIEQLRGMSPWVLMDFRSPYRVLPGVQDEFNRKGLISEKGEKKQAFYVLEKAYRERLVGRATPITAR